MTSPRPRNYAQPPGDKTLAGPGNFFRPDRRAYIAQAAKKSAATKAVFFLEPEGG